MPRPEQFRTRAHQSGLRFAADDKAALHALAAHYGISMSDVVTMLVRERVRKEALVVHPLAFYQP